MSRKNYEVVIAPSIAPAKFTERRTWKYRKNSALVIHEGGRYGTRWLRSLVFRAAVNLGMVGHDRSVTEELMVSCSRINSEKLSDQIEKALLNVMRCTGYNPSDLEIICGQDVFEEINFALRAQVAFYHQIYISQKDGDYTMKWRDVGIRIVPCVTGFAVIPLKGR